MTSNPIPLNKANRHSRTLRRAARAEDDGEVGHALHAGGIGWRADVDLVLVRPALRQRAVPWEAGLALAAATARAVGDRCGLEADVRVAALHHAQVVGDALHAHERSVAVLKESLGVPLVANRPFGVARQTHAGLLVRRSNDTLALRWDVLNVGLLDHLEVRGDLVESEALVEGAVVVDVDVEGAGASGLGLERHSGHGGCQSQRGNKALYEVVCRHGVVCGLFA